MASWVRGRFTKIVLSVDSQENLLAVHQTAIASGLPAALITDSGATEFHGVPTHIDVALGPADAASIDAITGPGGLVPTKLA